MENVHLLAIYNLNLYHFCCVSFLAIATRCRCTKLLGGGSNSISFSINIAGSICAVDHRSSIVSPAKYERENCVSYTFSGCCPHMAVSLHAYVSWEATAFGHMAAYVILLCKMCLLPSISVSNTMWLSKTGIRQFCKQWLLINALASVWIVWMPWAGQCHQSFNNFAIYYLYFQFYSYQMIPFLSEARTLLDWVCIKTSLTLYEWFKMEDIYSDLFIIKVRKSKVAHCWQISFGIFFIWMVFLVSSTIWKISTATSWSGSRNKSRLY